jgi:hypothetical protein
MGLSGAIKKTPGSLLRNCHKRFVGHLPNHCEKARDPINGQSGLERFNLKHQQHNQ